MWGIDDLVKKKFSRAVLQVESRDCVDPPRALWHAYSRLPCKGKPKDIGQFGLRWFDTALAMSGEQCAYRLSSITPSLEIRTTKANAGYGFNLRRGAFSWYVKMKQSNKDMEIKTSFRIQMNGFIRYK